MRRHLVTIKFIAPRLNSRQRRFWFRRSAERFSRRFEIEAWRLGYNTRCEISNIA